VSKAPNTRTCRATSSARSLSSPSAAWMCARATICVCTPSFCCSACFRRAAALASCSARISSPSCDGAGHDMPLACFLAWGSYRRTLGCMVGYYLEPSSGVERYLQPWPPALRAPACRSARRRVGARSVPCCTHNARAPGAHGPPAPPPGARSSWGGSVRACPLPQTHPPTGRRTKKTHNRGIQRARPAANPPLKQPPTWSMSILYRISSSSCARCRACKGRGGKRGQLLSARPL